MDSLSLMEVSLMLHFYKMYLLKILVYGESSNNYTDLYQALALVRVHQGPVLKLIFERFDCNWPLLSLAHHRNTVFL